MSNTCKDLRFYTSQQAIEYVGWLLACDAEQNIEKGKRILQELPSGEARIAALAHAVELKALYGED